MYAVKSLGRGRTAKLEPRQSGPGATVSWEPFGPSPEVLVASLQPIEPGSAAGPWM